MILETSRLWLRELNQTDYSSLCKMLKDEDVMYAYGGSFSDGEVQQWLDKQLQNYEKYGFGLWSVIQKENNEMIGQCGLTMQNFDNRQVLEIGYMFQKAYWHKGYAVEAAIACKEYAFDHLQADEVFSIIRDTNIPSQAVAKRNGMTICGQFIKHYRNVDMPHIVYSIKQKKNI